MFNVDVDVHIDIDVDIRCWHRRRCRHICRH